jgi:hypothetical protein
MSCRARGAHCLTEAEQPGTRWAKAEHEMSQSWARDEWGLSSRAQDEPKPSTRCVGGWAAGHEMSQSRARDEPKLSTRWVGAEQPGIRWAEAEHEMCGGWAAGHETSRSRARDERNPSMRCVGVEQLSGSPSGGGRRPPKIVLGVLFFTHCSLSIVLQQWQCFEYLKRVVLLIKTIRKSSLSFSSLCTLRDTQHISSYSFAPMPPSLQIIIGPSLSPVKHAQTITLTYADLNVFLTYFRLSLPLVDGSPIDGED